jgi:hypothetical protein
MSFHGDHMQDALPQLLFPSTLRRPSARRWHFLAPGLGLGAPIIATTWVTKIARDALKKTGNVNNRRENLALSENVRCREPARHDSNRLQAFQE